MRVKIYAVENNRKVYNSKFTGSCDKMVPIAICDDILFICIETLTAQIQIEITTFM